MSRMFELMRQTQLDESLLEKPVVPTSASGSTNSHNFELLRQAQKDELLFDTEESKVWRPRVDVDSSEFLGLRARRSNWSIVSSSRKRRWLREWWCSVPSTCEMKTVAPVRKPPNCSLVSRKTLLCVLWMLTWPGPRLHSYFHVDNGGGLSRAILDDGPVMGFTRPLDGIGLRLMAAGAPLAGEDANEMLASSRLRARMTELRTKFDYILIDAPPATLGSPTAYLAKLVDGFILLVEPSFTPQQAARTAKNNIEAAGGRVLGVVLLRRELRFLIQSGAGPA